MYTYMLREDIGTATLNSHHTVLLWLFLYTPSYRQLLRSGRGYYNFLKISLFSMWISGS